MARLIINPGTPNAWPVELAIGENIIGQGAENQITLDHPSVSPVHCSLTLGGGVAVLKDLGSSSGTSVNGQPVEEVALAPGTRFRAGEVELEFDPGLPTAISAQPNSEVVLAPVADGTRCKYHPQSLARHYCPRCRRAYCELCVETRSNFESSKRMCRVCGSPCQYIKARLALAEERPAF